MMKDYNKAFEEAFGKEENKDTQLKKMVKRSAGLVLVSLVFICISFLFTHN